MRVDRGQLLVNAVFNIIILWMWPNLNLNPTQRFATLPPSPPVFTLYNVYRIRLYRIVPTQSERASKERLLRGVRSYL